MISKLISQKFSRAFDRIGFGGEPPIVQNSTRPEFGDYQVNGIMPLAKKHNKNPKELAYQILKKIDLSEIAKKSEIAGPGFINIFLKPDFLANKLSYVLNDKKLGVEIESFPERSKKIIVEYSSPNLAKEMHVGHLRSTIIGDALSRIYEWLDYDLYRVNHVGDWGTQFGMLIAFLQDQQQVNNSKKKEFLLNDLELFYQQAKKKFDSDEDFADRARKVVVQLQAGNQEIKKLWSEFVEISLAHCLQVYSLLGVKLTTDHTFGESFYNNELAQIVQDLSEKKLLVEDQGAKVVFLDDESSQSGLNSDCEQENSVVIIQKKDGGYLYSTTDLAAIKYRIQKLHVKKIFYVVDSRQSQHFQQIFKLAQLVGYAKNEITLEHIDFGMVLSENKKPLRTRDGGVIKLIDLLSEAIDRAYQIVKDKNPSKSENWNRNVAKTIGLGAVKYADLSKARQSDYVFNWNQMLAFEGNTAPYLQYAYTRIQSIFRKNKNNTDLKTPIFLDRYNTSQWQLSIALAKFPEVIELVISKNEPHHLCSYLYNLAVIFSRFYESCPILSADKVTRESRLLICLLTSKILKQGLELLGIEVMEEM